MKNVKSIRNILKREGRLMPETFASTARSCLYKYRELSVKGGLYHEK